MVFETTIVWWYRIAYATRIIVEGHSLTSAICKRTTSLTNSWKQLWSSWIWKPDRLIRTPLLYCVRLYRFISVTYFISLFGVTNVRRCWKTDSRISQGADNMTINRYEEIKRIVISFVDCSQSNDSKLFKLFFHWPFRINYYKNYQRRIFFSVDEQIIPSKMKKSSLRQYNPKKP